MKMFDHRDSLSFLADALSLGEKLRRCHALLRDREAPVDRVAVALYDEKSDALKTFAHSSDGAVRLERYQASLASCPSLLDTRRVGRPRVIEDLEIFSGGEQRHTRSIEEAGYRSSYTFPMRDGGRFLGFLFFNSRQRSPFTEELLAELDLFAHLITQLVGNEMRSLETLSAALKTARDMADKRDTETGAHLERMSRYSRLIAQELADRRGFSDELIEKLALFAPLHDIGKLGIPDRILLKPGKLTADEFELMKRHVLIGRELVDAMLEHFGLADMRDASVLRHIVEFHHEKLDGTGYPKQLVGEAIPIEARIITVADIFDALTSRRPYKEAWSNDKAFAALDKLANNAVDADCVAALKKRHPEVEEIQRRFTEPEDGP